MQIRVFATSAALMIAAVAAHAESPVGNDGVEAYITRMLELRVRDRESDLRRQADDCERDTAQELRRARAREMTWLVEEVLIEAELRSVDLGASRRLSLDPAAVTSSNSNGARSFDDARRLYTTDDAVSLGAFQDEPPTAQGVSEDSPVDKSDQTGTNPINFTFDFRVYNEYQWLNTAGDGDQNITTLEFRAPILDGKWQFRVRARGNVINADLNDDGVDELDESGFGDLDFRFLTVPYLDMPSKMALAVGLEVFLDTASDDALGSGSTSLGPQVFLVLFKPFGLDLDLFTPAYQHKVSVSGNDVNQSLIDLFILKTSQDKTLWALVDPQIVIDYESDTEFLLLDIEVGTMLDKYLGTKGHSAYVRPSVGIGGHRPYDFSIECGYKIVW